MFEQDLFETVSTLEHTGAHISGLTYVGNFVTSDEATRVVNAIDRASWSSDLKRRVQHYGYKYDYKSRSINEKMRAEPLPQWAMRLGNRLVKKGLFTRPPDQVIVNEYMPGQGITPHIDCIPCFGEVVASLSLLSSCIMSFESASSTDIVDLDLSPNSLILMAGDARFSWKHGIAARIHDKFGSVMRRRSRRVSATFRTVIIK